MVDLDSFFLFSFYLKKILRHTLLAVCGSVVRLEQRQMFKSIFCSKQILKVEFSFALKLLIYVLREINYLLLNSEKFQSKFNKGHALKTSKLLIINNYFSIIY